ncbi:MAG: orotidine-5'-phosphate decarboxylase [Limnochordia bacterium]|nr:orotidine-5'-phosphate decarboxylase [Limnochordia bacterium]
MSVAERIIVALDLGSREEVEKALENLPQVRFVKVGMELFYSEGPELIHVLKDRGLKIFLDLKVHDIPNTAAGAMRSLSRAGCDLLNLHCQGGLEMMKRAREAVGDDTRLIGVTQLTSTNKRMLNDELGIAGTVEASVLSYAQLAKEANLAGVVCSPLEVRAIKEVCGADFLAVTPGVRPRGSASQDQKRTMTPQEAIQAGSDYLVIGRPILTSPDPHGAFLGIVEEIGVKVR